MILNIDPIRSAVVSLFSAAAGSLYNHFPHLCANISVETTNIMFQHAAWFVAIIAGLISAWNGLMTARETYRKNHPKNR